MNAYTLKYQCLLLSTVKLGYYHDLTKVFGKENVDKEIESLRNEGLLDGSIEKVNLYITKDGREEFERMKSEDKTG